MTMEEANEVIAPLLRRLYASALQLTRSVGDADDVVQDAVLRVLLRIQSIEKDRLPGYLFTTLRHAAFGWKRRDCDLPMPLDWKDRREVDPAAADPEELLLSNHPEYLYAAAIDLARHKTRQTIVAFLLSDDNRPRMAELFATRRHLVDARVERLRNWLCSRPPCEFYDDEYLMGRMRPALEHGLTEIRDALIALKTPKQVSLTLLEQKRPLIEELFSREALDEAITPDLWAAIVDDATVREYQQEFRRKAASIYEAVGGQFGCPAASVELAYRIHENLGGRGTPYVIEHDMGPGDEPDPSFMLSAYAIPTPVPDVEPPILASAYAEQWRKVRQYQGREDVLEQNTLTKLRRAILRRMVRIIFRHGISELGTTLLFDAP